MSFPNENPSGLGPVVAGLDPASAIVEGSFNGVVITSAPSGQALIWAADLTSWENRSFWNTEDPPLLDYNNVAILVNKDALVDIVAEVRLSIAEQPGDYAVISMTSPGGTGNFQAGKCAFREQVAVCVWRGKLSAQAGPWSIQTLVASSAGTTVQSGGHFSLTASLMPF